MRVLTEPEEELGTDLQRVKQDMTTRAVGSKNVDSFGGYTSQVLVNWDAVSCIRFSSQPTSELADRDAR